MQEVLKQIKEQRKEREPKAKEYAAKKVAWAAQKKVCDKLAKELKELKEVLGMQSQKDLKAKAKAKAKEVEEKMKRGEKLTTKDFLAMQGMK